VIQKY
jgi:hypothetical protein